MASFAPMHRDDDVRPLVGAIRSAVLGLSVLFAVVELGRIWMLEPVDDRVVAAVAVALFLPLHLRHLHTGLAGRRPRGASWTFAVMAVVHVASLVLVGPAWSLMLTALATSALVLLPWSAAVVTAVACALGPVVAHAADPAVLDGFGVAVEDLVVTVVVRCGLLFSLVWLVGTTRELARSRVVLAAVRARQERLRLEDGVRSALGGRARAMGELGRRAGSALREPGPSAALVSLDRLVAIARETLAEVRRVLGATCPDPGPAAPAADAAVVTRARAAWMPFAVVHVLVLVPLLLLVALRVIGPSASDVEGTSDALGWAPGIGAGPDLVIGGWVVVAALHLGLAVEIAAGRTPRAGAARAGLLVAAAVILLPFVGPAWGAALSCAGAAVALVVADRRACPAMAVMAIAFAAFDTLVVAALPGSIAAGEVAWAVSSALATSGLTMAGLFASTRLVAVAGELAATREAVAVEAAAAERRRLARDLHDVLGQDLTAIALKADLARRLLPGDRAGADRELREVVALADAQVGELRAVAREERPIALDAELDRSVALLRRTGATVDVRREGAPDDPVARETLAWAAREATTNVLRHARPARCALRYGARDGVAWFELVNDGASPCRASRSGLDGLAVRAAAAGGRLRAEPLDAGRFRLRVDVPCRVPA